MNPQLPPAPPAHTELLILPDGRVLVHNLTASMAGVLAQLDPEDAFMRRRAAGAKGKESAPKRRRKRTEPA